MNIMSKNRLKVLYLFNNTRLQMLENARNSKDNDDHLMGLLRLSRFKIDASFQEIELFFPKFLCRFMRRFIPIYFIHLPIFWKIFKYDIVFSTSAFGIQMFHALFNFHRPKWVMLDFSITGFMNKNKSWPSRIFKWMVSRSSGIVTISKKEADILKNIFPKKIIEFIPFGTDTDFFQSKDIPKLDQVLTVGRDPGRDYDTLFSACSSLGIKVVATISRKLIEYKNIPDFVSVQRLDPPDLISEYSKSKIFILPLDTKGGINDAMGCSTLVEAMSMGMAIIATRTPTTESYITHGENGFLVEAGNVNEMKSYIEKLLKDDNMRLNFGRQARIFAVKECSSDIFAQRLAEFFDKVHNSKN
jgi:glycosyltransferase involved in cell wall biosynthesis